MKVVVTKRGEILPVVGFSAGKVVAEDTNGATRKFLADRVVVREATGADMAVLDAKANEAEAKAEQLDKRLKALWGAYARGEVIDFVTRAKAGAEYNGD